MTYKYLFFDIDNTLLDFNLAEYDALKALFLENDLELDDEKLQIYREINGDLWKRHESEHLPIQTVLNTRFKVLFERFGHNSDGMLMEQTFRRHLEEGHALMPGAYTLLESLKDYRLFIVTNGVATTQHKRLKLAGINHFFESYFISSELGIQKPHAEFFEKAFSSIKDFDPSKSLIIGDTLGADILGGNNVSVDTVWYNPNQRDNLSDIQPTYTITHLQELNQILKV